MHRPDRHEDERLSAFLDDELDEDAALAVTRHLTGCERCLDELNDLRACRAALRGLPALEPPAGVVAGATPTVRSGTSSRLSLAVGLLVILVVTAFLAGEDNGGEVAPQVDVYVADHIARTSGDPVIRPATLGP